MNLAGVRHEFADRGDDYDTRDDHDKDGVRERNPFRRALLRTISNSAAFEMMSEQGEPDRRAVCDVFRSCCQNAERMRAESNDS